MPSRKKHISMLPEFVQEMYLSFKNKSQLSKWNKEGCPIPPPHVVKQDKILKYKDLYKIETLVETGTYLGDMVWAQRHNFSQIYSIELDKRLAKAAQKRFKKYQNITIIQGDSGKVLTKTVSSITDRAIFWLDAHYSGGITARGDKDCPLYEELKAILSTNIEHILLIDDARQFIGERDFPSIEGITIYIRNIYPNSIISVENNCIIVDLKL